MSVSASTIKELRDRTGIAMGKCKTALMEANGDIELAIDNLRKAGMATAVKKEGRETKEAIIGSFETSDVLALAEVSAETDFVINNDRFRAFLSDIAEEVANTKPASLEDFLKQPFSKDSALTVDEYRASLVQTIGENIQIKRVHVQPKDGSSSFGVYLHLGGKIATVVEITGSNEVSTLARDIAMHAAAAAPEYLSPEEIPSSVVDHEKEIARSQMKGKPENILDKIIAGKLNAYYDDCCLMRQKFIKDDSMSVSDLVAKKAKELDTSLTVKSFLRWSIG